MTLQYTIVFYHFSTYPLKSKEKSNGKFHKMRYFNSGFWGIIQHFAHMEKRRKLGFIGLFVVATAL